jgi:Ni/Fe-hydrogenase subunit HybB-like protein
MTEYPESIESMLKALKDKVIAQEEGHDESQVFWSGVNAYLILIAPLVGSALSGIGTIVAAQSNNYAWSLVFGILTTLLSGLSILIATLREQFKPRERGIKHVESKLKYSSLKDDIEQFYTRKGLDEEALLSGYNNFFQRFLALQTEDKNNDIMLASRVRRKGLFSWLRPGRFADENRGLSGPEKPAHS